MAPKSIALQTLRRDLSRIIGEVTYGGRTYIIEQYGRPAAVLLSIDEFRRLQSEAPEAERQPARILSPHLADRSRVGDFDLQVIEE